MLISLLNPENYISFNCHLANLLGLHQAIYLSELISINDKAISKHKTNNNYFELNRQYIYERTTLTFDEQLSIESKLEKIGVLQKPQNDENSMFLNISVITTMMMSEDEELINDISKIVKKRTRKSSQKQEMFQKLKSAVKTKNEELIQAYGQWIESVVAKRGYMPKKAVTVAQQVIDSYSQHNLDVALKLLQIATIGGYRDITWAINSYEKNNFYKMKMSVPLQAKNIQSSQDVSKQTVF